MKTVLTALMLLLLNTVTSGQDYIFETSPGFMIIREGESNLIPGFQGDIIIHKVFNDEFTVGLGSNYTAYKPKSELGIRHSNAVVANVGILVEDQIHINLVGRWHWHRRASSGAIRAAMFPYPGKFRMGLFGELGILQEERRGYAAVGAYFGFFHNRKK